MMAAHHSEIGIQDFEMIRLIGEGGMGSVWSAKKIDSNEVRSDLSVV